MPPLQEDEGGEYTSERSRLLQAVPRLVDEWIEKDLLRPVTLDEAGVKFPPRLLSVSASQPSLGQQHLIC